MYTDEVVKFLKRYKGGTGGVRVYPQRPRPAIAQDRPLLQCNPFLGKRRQSMAAVPNWPLKTDVAQQRKALVSSATRMRATNSGLHVPPSLSGAAHLFVPKSPVAMLRANGPHPVALRSPQRLAPTHSQQAHTSHLLAQRAARRAAAAYSNASRGHTRSSGFLGSLSVSVRDTIAPREVSLARRPATAITVASAARGGGGGGSTRLRSGIGAAAATAATKPAASKPPTPTQTVAARAVTSGRVERAARWPSMSSSANTSMGQPASVAVSEALDTRWQFTRPSPAAEIKAASLQTNLFRGSGGGGGGSGSGSGSGGLSAVTRRRSPMARRGGKQHAPSQAAARTAQVAAAKPRYHTLRASPVWGVRHDYCR